MHYNLMVENITVEQFWDQDAFFHKFNEVVFEQEAESIRDLMFNDVFDN